MRALGLIPHRSRLPVLPNVRSFDDVLDDFWRGFGLAPAWTDTEGARAFSPRIDVRESEKELVVTAELPGLAEGDFEVVLDADVLSIKGRKSVEQEEKAEGFRHVESVSGAFHRRVTLPDEVDVDAVEAQYTNGVLTVSLPKLPEAQRQARTIPISTS